MKLKKLEFIEKRQKNVITSVDTIVQEYLQMKSLLSYYGDKLLPNHYTDSKFQTKKKVLDKNNFESCTVRKIYKNVRNDGNHGTDFVTIRNCEIGGDDDMKSKAGCFPLDRDRDKDRDRDRDRDRDIGNKPFHQALSMIIPEQAENLRTFQINRKISRLVSTDSYSEIEKQTVGMWTPEQGIYVSHMIY